MLFSSNVFLFLFLPVALLGFQTFSYFGRTPLFAWLAFISLVFYGYWNPPYILLLLASVSANYCFSVLISRARESIKTRILIIAITANIGLLVWFKYLFPVLRYFHHDGWLGNNIIGLLLPLGISFFTFTQIAYLVDLTQEMTQLQDFLSYLLFVTFFPHLIAGPIIHHSEMMPQFAMNRKIGIQSSDLSVGVTWFVLGLGKKVLLADRFGPVADALYAHPGDFGFVATWIGLLCYAFQLYFDFSGYSDMALGLARMFSISFPVNFNSPYKATSIIDFWQRWHMTLSRYLGAYLYNPIAMAVSHHRIKLGRKVNRRAIRTTEGFSSMIVIPMLTTMLLAGVWHGAGIQFIIFGGLHGLFLTINHGYRIFVPEEARLRRMTPKAANTLLTFGSVLIGQVFFRASSVRSALYVLGTLLGIHGNGPSLEKVLQQLDNFPAYSRFLLHPRGAIAGLCFCFVVVWGLPNTQELLGQLEKGAIRNRSLLPSLLWRPNFTWAAGLCAVLIASLMLISESTSFLYFQF